MRQIATIVSILAIASTSGRAQSLREVFRQVAPSVALVETEETALAGHGGQDSDPQEYTGSGFLVSDDGKLLTASHVVQVAERISVTFPNSKPVGAHVLASEPTADVALLQLDRVPSGTKAIPLGNSDDMEVGDEVFAVGAPLGISQTLSYGHISGIRKPHRVFGDLSTGEEELLQTDADINQGNSGGPLFNMAGEAVGIVSFGFGESEGAKGLNFVVASNTARKLLLVEKSLWSGFEGYPLHGELAEAFNLPQPEGILVQRVASGSPAEQLGLRPGSIEATIDDETVLLGGDIILAIDGVKVGGEDFPARLREALATFPAAKMTRVTVLRDGKRLELRSDSRLNSSPRNSSKENAPIDAGLGPEPAPSSPAKKDSKIWVRPSEPRP